MNARSIQIGFPGFLEDDQLAEEIGYSFFPAMESRFQPAIWQLTN
jgi:hypothetical protein